MKIVSYLITDFGNGLPLLLFGLLFIDFCYSVASMNAFQKEVAKISKELESKKAEISEGISELKVETKQKLSTNHLPTNHLRFNQKRMLNSYRKINMPDIKYFKEIKELQNQKNIRKKLPIKSDNWKFLFQKKITKRHFCVTFHRFRLKFSNFFN